ncbi:MAG: indolepyruvate ferredoxin oxidoreductase, beta subunit [Variibacter sp.]|nr:indolepyruvate ferredoxin oxidoreductase, beta subunit [Variibacter sp.]
MSAEPIKILIAALGGEGGGVLTNWIVQAATRAGFPVQSTSVPGVAQRTGATTYYVEIYPVPIKELGGRMPILALSPGPGEVDLLVASELMEAGRTIGAGYPSADRTLIIASTHRSYLVTETMAMSDGRYDPERLQAAVRQSSRERRLLDMAALAKENGAMINAVMLGAMAGSGVLPIAPALFEEAIRTEGKSTEANLRGFEAGRRAVASPKVERKTGGPATLTTAFALSADRIKSFPAAAHAFIREGARRLSHYQDSRYAELYLDRLKDIAAADATSGADGQLVRETARHLALRMSYEDVIRVAQEKINPERLSRIAKEVNAGGNPFTVAEFFSPGVDEFCSILPPALARRVLGVVERRGWKERLNFSMKVKTTTVLGYLRLWALAKLRPLRPRTYRYQREQTSIEAWLGSVASAARIAPELALEIVECARLIKGYGDTHARGTHNYALIATHVIEPALAGDLSARQAIDAIASARAAALADPEGDALARTLREINARVPLLAAAE